MFRIDAGSRIVNCDEDVCGPLLGDDRQHSRPLFDRPHCFDRVQDQIEHDLLQLNAIAANGSHARGEAGATETLFFSIGACTISITSWIASLRSKRSFVEVLS